MADTKLHTDPTARGHGQPVTLLSAADKLAKCGKHTPWKSLLRSRVLRLLATDNLFARAFAEEERESARCQSRPVKTALHPKTRDHHEAQTCEFHASDDGRAASPIGVHNELLNLRLPDYQLWSYLHRIHETPSTRAWTKASELSRHSGRLAKTRRNGALFAPAADLPNRCATPRRTRLTGSHEEDSPNWDGQHNTHPRSTSKR